MSDGSVMVTFEVAFKPGVGDGFALRMPEDLEATRNFAGCRSLAAYRNKNDPDRFVVIEHWENESAYAAYFQWRQDSGAFDELADLVTALPTTNIWNDLAPD